MANNKDLTKKEEIIVEEVIKKQKYIKRGAVIGDNLGWLGIALPFPLFIVLSLIFALIGGGIGLVVYFCKTFDLVLLSFLFVPKRSERNGN